jgi:hypothetical protein
MLLVIVTVGLATVGLVLGVTRTCGLQDNLLDTVEVYDVLGDATASSGMSLLQRTV